MTATTALYFLCLAGLLTSTLCQVHNLDTEYRFSVKLSDTYSFHWNFDLDTQYIEFAVAAQATGWVGFGLSPNGMMPRSDVVIGWVDNNGTAFLHDRYAYGRFTPPIDSEQNWFLISGEEIEGMTILRFWRNFTSCDELDLTISTGTDRVVGSYHSTDDPTSPQQERLPFHTFKRARSVNLLKGMPTQRTTPSDENSFQIRNINYTIPSSDTTYYCSLHYLPYLVFDVDILQDPIYLFKIAPLISEANRRFVHHMLVFICPRDSTVEIDGLCDEIASSFFGCFGGQIIAAWAVGGENYIFPEDVAFPLGGQNRPFKILLEVHYDNPDMVSGIIDSSGIQFFYTKQKPLHEAGGISVALPIIPLMIIPPKAELFSHSATCLSSCTDKYLPDEGITVFATFLHTHLIGTALHVRHFRNNEECGAIEELPLIDSNPTYDFDYQQLSNLPKTIQFLKGDTVRVDCFYNSKMRNKVTLGGESTRQEMCQALLYYYPRIELTNCGSFPDPNTAHRPFLQDVLMNDNAQVTPLINALNRDDYNGIANGFNNIYWDASTISQFQTAMNRAHYEREFCSDELNSTAVGTPLRPAFVGADCPFIEPDPCGGPPVHLLQSCCSRLEQEDDTPSPTLGPSPTSGATSLYPTPAVVLVTGIMTLYAVLHTFK